MKSIQKENSSTSDIAKKLAQREAELAVINSVQAGLLAKMEMQAIYDLVGEQIRDLFDAQVAAVSIFNHENQTEEFQYVFEEGERHDVDPRPIDKVRQRLIDTAEPICINENANEVWTELTGEEPTVVPGTKLTKSALYVPMVAQKRVFGYISIQNLDRENAFSDSDIRMLSTLANSISVALMNARLFNETGQRNAELAVINSVQQALASRLDMQGVYDLIGEHIREVFDAQAVVIRTFDTEAGLERWHYAIEKGNRKTVPPRPLDDFARYLHSLREPLVINDRFSDFIRKFSDETSVEGETPKSAVFVPLVSGDIIGNISLQDVDREGVFNHEDVRLLTTLANSMSVALENARLFSETQQRNAELAVINSVQEGLVAEMQLQGIYDLVGDRIRELFDSQVTIIATFDHEDKKEYFQYLYEAGRRYYPEPRKFDNLRQHLIEDRKTIHINENAVLAIRELGASIQAVPGTKFPKSLLFVPLIIGDTVRGYVSLQNLDRNYAFSDSDARLLGTLANSMSVALENARLFSETEQRNAELAVINSVQEGLVAEMDMQGIYDLVGDRIRDLFDSQVTMIVTFDHDTSTEYFHYLFEDGERLYPNSRPLNKIRKWIIEHATLLLVNEDADETIHRITGEPKGTTIPGTRLPQSLLFVPLIVGDEVRGCVSLQNLDREHAFSEADARLLNMLANSMSVALENARLFNETTRLLAVTEQRNAELAVINSVQDGLVREMDMQTIYEIVGDKICDVLDTQTMIIRTFNHDEGLEYWQYAVEMGERIEVDPQPFIFANEILIETKKHLLINEDFEEFAVKHGDTPTTKGLAPKSAIFVPMIVGDKVVGSISLQNVEKEHAFDESDLQLISTLNNSMSVAVENARLFNETTRLLGETEKRAAEMQTVNNISRAMVSQLEFDKLIQLVGDQMKSLFNADIVYLAIHDVKSNMLHFPYIYGDDTITSRPFANNITEKIIKTREPLLVNQDLKKTYEELKLHRRGEWVESYLGVPIIAGQEAIGVISVQSKSTDTRFNENDQRLLTTIAANVSVAMQNAEAYQKLRSALDDLKSAQEQLVQQEKLASLGQLTAGIAHEIKNPLNFVNNFSEVSLELVEELREEVRRETEDRGQAGNTPLLGGAGGRSGKAEEGDQPQNSEADSRSDNTPLNPLSPMQSGQARGDFLLEILNDIEANLRKIHEHGSRADSIVKSMLQHSRGGDGTMEPNPLNPLIKEYVNLAFHGMRAGKEPINVDIELELDETIDEVPLIAEDFSRVILNLCNNAFDAMRDKQGSGHKAPRQPPGPEKHRQGSGGYEPKLTVRTKSENGSVIIEIEDNGPGIPEEIKDKILQPFFTTKKGTQGTGLGLSITNDIVNAHGGSMDVYSQTGKTTFTIKLTV